MTDLKTQIAQVISGEPCPSKASVKVAERVMALVEGEIAARVSERDQAIEERERLWELMQSGGAAPDAQSMETGR